MRRTSSAMAGSVDHRTKRTVTVILNLILIGFYYAFGGTEAAMGLSVLSAVAVFFILINSCAFPFTEAAFISRFTGKNDYKSVLYVRLVSLILTMSVSVFFALILIIASGPLSGLILGFTNAAKDQLLIRLCLVFGALYGVACAWVSWLRGFWQGMGEMKIDERSQMISSVSFYIFSFVIMIILVHGFHLNRSFAAIGAAGGLLLSQALAGGFLTLYDTMKIKKLQKMAKAQMIPAMTKKKVFVELLKFTVPSGITSLIFGLMIMIPVFMTVSTAMAYRVKAVDAEKILALYGALIPAVTTVTLPVAQNCGDINIPKLAETFEKLGIPLKERDVLAGVVAVDAVFDSVSVTTTFRKTLAEKGIIFCSFSEAVKEHPDLVRKYLATVVPSGDNYFAALNSAVFSDGSFCYIPKGVRCPMDLSSYFRINARGTGQFERTLIVADEGSYVSYMEGCTAPMSSTPPSRTGIRATPRVRAVS